MKRNNLLCLLLFAMQLPFAGGALSAMAADDDLIYKDDATYRNWPIGSNQIYIHPEWLRRSERDAFDDKQTRSMIVKDGLMYICDNLDADENTIVLESYDAFTGEKRGFLNVPINSDMSKADYYLACDSEGNPFVLELLYCNPNNNLTSLNLDLAAVELSNGTLSNKMKVSLNDNLIDFSQNFVSSGNPTIKGDILSGSFELLIPVYLSDNSYDNTCSVAIYNVIFNKFEQQSYSLEAKKENLTFSYAYQYAAPHVVLLDNGYFYLDGNDGDPIMYVTQGDNKGWSEPLGLPYVGDYPIFMKGGHFFQFAGKRWIAGPTNLSNDHYAQILISSWDTEYYDDFLDLNLKWTIPQNKLSSESYSVPLNYPVALIQTVDYKAITGRDVTQLCFYIPGLGMGSYQLSTVPDYTSVDETLAEPTVEWSISGAHLSIAPGYRNATIYTPTGAVVATFAAEAVEMDLAPGIYLLNIDGSTAKIIAR